MSRRKGSVTLAEEKEILLRHTRGEPLRSIAADMGRSFTTVQRYARQASLRAVNAAIKTLDAEEANAIRREQKGRLLQRLAGMTDKACNLVETHVDAGDPGAFNQAMNGLERLDRVSGGASGETTPQAGPVHVDLKLLIQTVLGSDLPVVEVKPE